MVLSNKKLKQKLRSVLLTESSTQSDSQPHKSFKSLFNSVTPKPKLNKREIGRVKNPSVKSKPDQKTGGVEKESEEIDGELKNNNKRKREEKDGVDKDKGLSDNNNINNNNNKKKKKKNVKKKKVVKKDEEGVQKANAGSEEQGVKEESQGQPQSQSQSQTQISKEDENICTKIYVGGIPYYSTVEDIQSFFEGCGSITEIDCLKFPETGKFNGIAMISFRTEAAAKRALALDGSDMGGLSLKIQPFKATRDKKVSDFTPAMLEGYNRIYVGNLSWDMTEDELKKFFSDCNISSVRLGKDKETGEFKGFAHVDFADNMSLTMALELDQKPLFGRPVRVRCAVAPKSVNPGSKVDPTISKSGSDGVASKGKRQTCYGCGEKGHLSSSWPNKKAADMAPTGGKTDDVANGSVSADNIGDGKAKGRTCYECGEKHLSSSCPNKKAADVAYTGGRTDDVAFDQGEKEADHVGDGKIKRRTCYECGEKGHLSSLCPNKKAADVAHTYNRTDDLAFHKDEMEVDNIGDGKIKRRTCYECGEKGHLSSSCPKKQGADVANSLPETFADVAVKGNEEVDYNTVNLVSDGKLKRRTCYECGERGHLSSLCPKKQAGDVPNSRSETFAHVAVKDNEEVDYNTVNTVSDGKLRRRTCYECGERGHLSSLCPKKQAADVASSVKEVEKAEVVVGKEVSEGKLRRRTCYECSERGHLSSLCPKKQAADMANSSKIDNNVAVEEVKTPVAVSDSKLKRRNCYECGLKGHVSSLCPNKSQTSFAA
ncbi:phragmoplastin interacting protein 1-like [Bidens hawaiensis]|uniref:phragmoplastin interacting protein 1-like n=1 Tax=Bidens hawaiensis TaxID=980011 RepID=UPI00404AB256